VCVIKCKNCSDDKLYTIAHLSQFMPFVIKKKLRFPKKLFRKKHGTINVPIHLCVIKCGNFSGDILSMMSHLSQCLPLVIKITRIPKRKTIPKKTWYNLCPLI
jgi:hypothetical protein